MPQNVFSKSPVDIGQLVSALSLCATDRRSVYRWSLLGHCVRGGWRRQREVMSATDAQQAPLSDVGWLVVWALQGRLRRDIGGVSLGRSSAQSLVAQPPIAVVWARIVGGPLVTLFRSLRDPAPNGPPSVDGCHEVAVAKPGGASGRAKARVAANRPHAAHLGGRGWAGKGVQTRRPYPAAHVDCPSAQQTRAAQVDVSATMGALCLARAQEVTQVAFGGSTLERPALVMVEGQTLAFASDGRDCHYRRARVDRRTL